jgi:hypothetical protein
MVHSKECGYMPHVHLRKLFELIQVQKHGLLRAKKNEQRITYF